ncbi:MAG: endolytic transglycosylase MltG [Clostridiales bacterium]|nr:endolytic transglycosylase MltG [Clostridiales bacterium]
MERAGNKGKLALVICLLIILTVAFFAARWLLRIYSDTYDFERTVTLSEPVTVTINPGLGSSQISEILYEAGLTNSSQIFRSYAKEKEIDNILRPGEYSFEGEVSLADIADALAKGGLEASKGIKVTLPEGLTLPEIAAVLESKGIVEAAAFLEYTENAQLDFDYLPVIGSLNRLEGFLFPETYQMDPGWDEAKVTDLLLKQFDKIWKKEWQQRADELGMNALEIITLASIIEREARVDTDRPLISGVFHNRLAIDMLLQSCATVQFVLGERKEILTYADLEIESPYNTYKYKGLPPGPIACPGQLSIEAALYPEDSDYLFFVAKPDGSHHFSKTLAEHEAAKKKYL